jgi:DeoR family fructose operon transcriptional repressor
MIPFERQQMMLKLLESGEVVSLDTLMAEIPDISESTIRRDLKALEANDQITLLRGGGVCLKHSTSFDVPVSSKTERNVNEKERIAKKAASFVKDGDSIFLDSGSTVLCMLSYLQNKKVTIVTTNVMVPQRMQQLQSNDISCIILGGNLKVSTGSTIGTMTNDALPPFFFDEAFIGISGISDRAGMSTPDDREAEKKRIAVRNSRRSYILTDSSKMGITTMCKVFELGEVPVICDKAIEPVLSTGNYIIADEETE